MNQATYVDKVLFTALNYTIHSDIVKLLLLKSDIKPIGQKCTVDFQLSELPNHLHGLEKTIHVFGIYQSNQ